MANKPENMKDNTYKTGHFKYSTPEELKKVFAKLCKHLEGGFSIYSFADIDHTTVDAYCKRFPKEFPSDELRAAKAKGRQFWEGVEKDGIVGINPNFKEKSFQFKMMNSYGLTINQNSNSNVNLIVKDVADMDEDELKEHAYGKR